MIFCPEEICDLRNAVTDGSIENYELDWGEAEPVLPEELPLDETLILLDESQRISDNNIDESIPAPCVREPIKSLELR